MRAVAGQAEIALGLVSYYFEDRTALVAAALRRIGDQDTEIIHPPPDLDPATRLRHALRRVADAELLDSDYLALRLHLWSLALAEPPYARINQDAQSRYPDGLGSLLAAARPDLHADEIARRATDILVIQNGIWLTNLLVPDRDAIERGVRRCEAIAFAP
jgi:AcrR family transcriptional regulator